MTEVATILVLNQSQAARAVDDLQGTVIEAQVSSKAILEAITSALE